MSADTLSSIATSIAGMSSLDYAFLLLKMGGVLVGALVGLIGFTMAALKAVTSVWGVILERVRYDLSSSFCTPAQLAEAMEKVSKDFKAGDDRMERIEDTAQGTKEAVDLLSKRLNKVLLLLAAGGAGNPTLPAAAVRTAMESDDSIFPLGEMLAPRNGGHA